MKIRHEMTIHACPRLNCTLQGATASLDLVRADGAGSDDSDRSSELYDRLVVPVKGTIHLCRFNLAEFVLSGVGVFGKKVLTHAGTDELLLCSLGSSILGVRSRGLCIDIGNFPIGLPRKEETDKKYSDL